jgi:hypothetical protein
MITFFQGLLKSCQKDSMVQFMTRFLQRDASRRKLSVQVMHNGMLCSPSLKKYTFVLAILEALHQSTVRAVLTHMQGRHLPKFQSNF